MEILRMTGISKTFPNGTVALKNVDFHLGKGEVVSLLGENGAGKTTLMKILYGMISSNSGEIHLNGNPVTLRRPLDAIRHGICMVHQHFMLVPAFSVTENVVVGDEPTRSLFVDAAKAKSEVAGLINKFKFNLDPDMPVSKLSVGEQQRVEILKALYRKTQILILDEPTAVLTPHEVDELFVVLNQLREQGTSIIIITHKLRETMAIADRIAVLRDGVMMQNDVKPSETTTEKLSQMMVGRQIEIDKRYPAEHVGDVIFEVKNLNLSEDGYQKLKNISFAVRAGEILGVAGIEGNGQTQLLEAITGLCEYDTMELYVNSAPLSGDANTILRANIGHVPEDRLSMGLVSELSVRLNMILGYHREKSFCEKNFLKGNDIQKYAAELVEKFGVKTGSIETTVGSLSGGNQQKVIIARTLSQNPDVLIVAHPTRGVDVGAQEYIHSQIIKMRDAGKAVLLVSADLDEVRTLSDRIIVLYEGEIVSESEATKYSEVQLGLLMTGSFADAQEEVV